MGHKRFVLLRYVAIGDSVIKGTVAAEVFEMTDVVSGVLTDRGIKVRSGRTSIIKGSVGLETVAITDVDSGTQVDSGTKVSSGRG